MTQDELRNVSLAELCKRLEAGWQQPDNADHIDLDAALRYLTSPLEDTQTEQTVDALLHLARNFHYAARPAECLRSASYAARLAKGLEDKSQLYRACVLEGVALSELGRFAEATVAHVEGWSLARVMDDVQREIWAIGNLGALCFGMGQWSAAIRYFEKARSMAEEYGFADLEFHSRTNLADCAVQLRDPVGGLAALSQFRTETPETRPQMSVSANGLNTLSRLHLLAGNLDAARIHAEESSRLARTARLEKIAPNSEAVLALIDVFSGAVDKGFPVLERALLFAKQKSQIELPDYLGMCIDAYEAVGRADKALEYLQELVEWKRKSAEAAVTPLQHEGLTGAIGSETSTSFSDDGLPARAYLLETGVSDRVERFVETAINAELANGHDLYRTFRVAKLARHLGAAIGWKGKRLDVLSLGAHLCNIGMIAIPARILQKPCGLSPSERLVIADHTVYGADLLRKSQLRVLEFASSIAGQHHEWYSGGGYPRGISAVAICDEAKIVSICDVFDAMTHPRPWRSTALSIQSTLTELEQRAGSQFDPLLVTSFVDLIRHQLSKYDDLDTFLIEGAHEFEYVRARARMESLLAETR